jgi:hypothetical protein
MSIAMMNKVVASGFIAPPEFGGPDVIYFDYDYRNAIQFRTKFPGAKSLGLGWLQSWTWHINMQGTPQLQHRLRLHF